MAHGDDPEIEGELEAVAEKFSLWSNSLSDRERQILGALLQAAGDETQGFGIFEDRWRAQDVKALILKLTPQTTEAIIRNLRV